MQGDNRLANLTWLEAEQRLPETDFVALPAGATEQHSHHLPLSVDTVRAEALTDEIAARAPEHNLEILVLPALPFGLSEHHMNFPGTVTLTPDTYVTMVAEIGECMHRHGAERLLFINYHAGNAGGLDQAADRLQREVGIQTHHVAWTDFARDLLDDLFGDWGHSGPHETSMMEYIAPELVRQDEKKPPNRTPRDKTRSYAYIDELTDTGALADPTLSDPEAIEAVIEEATNRLLAALADDIN